METNYLTQFIVIVVCAIDVACLIVIAIGTIRLRKLLKKILDD